MVNPLILTEVYLSLHQSHENTHELYEHLTQKFDDLEETLFIMGLPHIHSAVSNELNDFISQNTTSTQAVLTNTPSYPYTQVFTSKDIEIKPTLFLTKSIVQALCEKGTHDDLVRSIVDDKIHLNCLAWVLEESVGGKSLKDLTPQITAITSILYHTHPSLPSEAFQSLFTGELERFLVKRETYVWKYKLFCALLIEMVIISRDPKQKFKFKAFIHTMASFGKIYNGFVRLCYNTFHNLENIPSFFAFDNKSPQEILDDLHAKAWEIFLYESHEEFLAFQEKDGVFHYPLFVVPQESFFKAYTQNIRIDAFLKDFKKERTIPLSFNTYKDLGRKEQDFLAFIFSQEQVKKREALYEQHENGSFIGIEEFYVTALERLHT